MKDKFSKGTGQPMKDAQPTKVKDSPIKAAKPCSKDTATDLGGFELRAIVTPKIATKGANNVTHCMNPVKKKAMAASELATSPATTADVSTAMAM